MLITGRNRDSLLEATKTLGQNSDYVVFDNSDIADIPNLFISLREKLGTIDHMICNAGISNHDGDYSKVTEKSWDQTFDTNLKGSFFMAQEFLKVKHIKKEQYGSILFISSETGKQNYDIPYGLTKAALNSLTGALARREIKNGIRVNAIAPGVTVTEMTKSYTDILDGNYSFPSASGRLFLPEEIAETASFLLSDAAKCISGEIIHTNMGNHLNPWWEK